MRTPLHFSLGLLLVPMAALAQTTPVEGMRDNTPGVHALTNARVVTVPGRVLESATIVVRDGVIEAVGANARVPADATVRDVGGRTIYPGFIDAYSNVGMPSEHAEDEAERGTRYWNPQVRSFVDAAAELAAEDERATELRTQGFAVALAVPRLGMFRGQAAAVSLGDGSPADRVVRSGVAQAVTLVRDRDAGDGYPTSAMGAMAFVRQTLHDADWYARAHAAFERSPAGLRRPEANHALAALGAAVRGEQPVLFEATSDEDMLRILAIANEFPVSPWIRGSGREYRVLDAIGGLRAPLILPLAFPSAPEVENPDASLNVTLGDLRHWYLAPENPGRVARAGLEFALTADGLDRRDEFLPNLRRAVERGLPPETAIAALTTVPARYLGIQRTHGTIESGRAANLVVVDGDIFDSDATIREVWVDGRRYEVSPEPGADPRGRWLVAAADEPGLAGQLELTGEPGRLSGSITIDGEEVILASARVAGEARRLRLAFSGESLGIDGTVRLSGTVAGQEIYGWGELPDGRRVNWRAHRLEDVAADDAGGGGHGSGEGADVSVTADGAAFSRSTAGSRDARNRPAATLEPITLAEIRPAMEYGRERIPEQPADLVVRGATVWTMGPQGILENADLLVRRGRIVQVGQQLSAPRGAVEIEAAGKHVTPGLIDAHLHSGIHGGVNEVGAAIVPEVRIGDVLTIDNIWMYRQLAGGLTAAHVMHGSANPIGGQNQIVKMRWGALPEQLKLEGAPRSVKFALGENVKRRTGRYPDTRMGTEQIIRDHFKAALEYRQKWQEWERNRRGIPPRRDLRMEALLDILDGDILIQSHSYRQDEILMLVRLAEEFGVPIKAFHHGVEAYKVGPELAEHGAGAVIWTDWSSFKVEAYDATTFNARLLIDAGVVTSLHSDNSQIATRMNWEAAKMLRTGLDPEEALALVTINTARVLGIEDRVGSLEPGKDADFVIWSGDPLSTATVAEETWVDGRRYFDIEEDRELRRQVERERARLIQRVLDER